MNKWQCWVLMLICGSAVYLFDKIVSPHIKWDQISALPIINLLTIQILLYQIVISPSYSLYLGGYYKTKKKASVKRDSMYTLKQEQLRQFKQIEVWGFLWKWDVYFDFGGKPKIHDLCPYHEYQGTPIKMAQDRIMNVLVCGIPGGQVKMPTGWMYETNLDSEAIKRIGG